MLLDILCNPEYLMRSEQEQVDGSHAYIRKVIYRTRNCLSFTTAATVIISTFLLYFVISNIVIW